MATRRIGSETSATRAMLMDGVEAVMRELGYGALTARSVAERAGLKHQLVYYYFETMDELLMATYLRHTGRVVGAALSPDGKRVLSGGGDRTVRLWDADTGKELRKMTGHTGDVVSVAFGPKGRALSGSFDRTMRLWDCDTGKNVGVFSGHADVLREVAYVAPFSPVLGCCV